MMIKKKSAVLIARLMIVLLSLTLLACGPSKTESELSSRVSPTDATSTTKPLALCNGGASTQFVLHQKAYLNDSPTWDPNFVYVKFKQVPSTFATDSRYIEFFRWMAASDGTTSLDHSRLRFQIVDLSTNKLISETWRNTLSWPELGNAASATGISSAADLFKRLAFKIELNDPGGEYDVLRTQIFKFGKTAPEEYFDQLIPVFYANPADYAIEPAGSARAQILQNMHPLHGTALSNTDYASRMSAFCDTFGEF
ncbi:MAG: hypothetical protein IPK04_09985 [Bdellovibrionales bacterium]|nr:hypothetical protein [Bdellovibrionales bacterium]